MATLQKFKFLAVQCTAIASPTRSPTTSPIIHIRRRKTLRMLFGGRSGSGNGGVFHRRFYHHHHRRQDDDQQKVVGKNPPENGKENLSVRLKLKDLFISSSSPPSSILRDDARKVREDEETQGLLPAESSGGGLAVARRPVRPLSATIRQRLLMRRAWRPALVAIPEQSP